MLDLEAVARDQKRRRPGKRNTYATFVAGVNPGKPTVVKSIGFLICLAFRGIFEGTRVVYVLHARALRRFWSRATAF